MAAAPVPGAAPAPPSATAMIDCSSYTRLYSETNCASQRVDSQRVLREFAIPTKGVVRTGQQLHEDVKAMCNEIPHAYLTLVKDDPRLVLLHRGSYHPTPIGSVPELWNNKVLRRAGGKPSTAAAAFPQ
jgi:hypothetical protein